MKLPPIDLAGEKRAECSGKHPYPTKPAALKVIKRSGHGQTYRCRFCSSFHIGHK